MDPRSSGLGADHSRAVTSPGPRRHRQAEGSAGAADDAHARTADPGSAASAAPPASAPAAAAPASATISVPPPMPPPAAAAAADRREGAGGAGGGLLVKIGIVGDAGVGKTSLMVRYVEKRFDQDYVETLGVNFLEKTIDTPSAQVTLSLWDLGGDRSYVSMLPMVCVDAVAVLFMFDLTVKSTLLSVREWYRQVRGLNASALPFLVGTKFDLFYAQEKTEQEETTALARKYAKAMHAPLIFCSSSHSINVLKLFKLVFELVFSLEPDIEQKHAVGEPLFEY